MVFDGVRVSTSSSHEMIEYQTHIFAAARSAAARMDFPTTTPIVTWRDERKLLRMERIRGRNK